MTDEQFAALNRRFDAIEQHLAAHDQRFDAVDHHLAALDQRLDELTAEASLQRAALERFGFMGRRPTPPQRGELPVVEPGTGRRVRVRD